MIKLSAFAKIDNVINVHLVKGKGTYTLDIAPLRESSPQKRSGVARVLEGSYNFTCTPTRSSAIFQSIAGTHLPIPGDGRLSWPGWLVT